MKKRNLDEIIGKAVHRALIEAVGTWEPQLNQRAKEAANYQTKTLPVIYGLDYIPESRANNGGIAQENVRNFIYILKNDGQKKVKPSIYKKVMDKAVNYVCDSLIRSFGNNLGKLTLVPIPTHDIHTNTMRWKDMMFAICSRTGAENGFWLLLLPARPADLALPLQQRTR